jgi:hypothetical protein
LEMPSRVLGSRGIGVSRERRAWAGGGSRCPRTGVASKRPIGTRPGDGQKGVNMFVQVIQGHVSDAALVRAQLDRWAQEVAPGAVGWLGSTSGVTDDGTLIGRGRHAR